MTLVVEFDRGTLLVRGLEGDRAIGALPVRWDPRVQAHRARAMDDSALRRELKHSSRERPSSSAPTASARQLALNDAIVSLAWLPFPSSGDS